MSTELPSIAALKEQAKRLRAVLAEGGHSVGHSATLEMVAKQHGFKDWNAISARARTNSIPLPFNLGDRVRGEYMAQPICGRIHAVEEMSAGEFFRLTVDFDEAVDVVTFDSFSAFRKRVTCIVDKNGLSPKKRSDGVPHMVLTV